MVGIESDFKTLSIGDIHGNNSWKIACFGSIENYEIWRNCKDLSKLDTSLFPIYNYDKVIFIGDYVDSFHIKPIFIKHNLEEIIHLKTCFPNKVILLLGNHDIAYKNHEQRGWKSATMNWDYGTLFNTKINGESIFQVAFQYKDWLWSHAGITMGFMRFGIKPLLEDTQSRFSDFYKECKNLAEVLNLMYETNEKSIFYNASPIRGGIDKFSGPFWAHKDEMYKKPEFGLNQIVGHTHIQEIKSYWLNRGRYTQNPASVHFIDNLGNAREVLSIKFSNDKAELKTIKLELADE